jgi:glycerol transport system ATP-binding protein
MPPPSRTEALLLGGYTAVMDAGELLQYGPTAEVFHRPKSMRVARAFSDPPMNLLAGRAATGVRAAGGLRLALALPARRIAVRGADRRHARQCAARAAPRPATWPARQVELAEISGSDTFVHVGTPVGELVAQLTGVHEFDAGRAVTLYLDPAQVYRVRRATARCCWRPAPHGKEGLTWHASTSTWPTPTSPTRSATRTTRCCR